MHCIIGQGLQLNEISRNLIIVVSLGFYSIINFDVNVGDDGLYEQEDLVQP